MNLKLDLIQLKECVFKQKRRPGNDKACVYNLALKKYDVRESNSDKGFLYDVDLEFDLMFRVARPLIAFSCVYHMRYSGDAEGRMRLKEHIVVAHAIPYLREFVANLTMRSELPVLMMDPVNAVNLFNDFSSRSSTQKHADGAVAK